MKKGNPWALLPILCFLVVFIGMGVWLNDFYAMPAIVGFLIALGVAFCQNRKRSFSEKMEDVTHSMGDSNVMIMCLVFVMAGGFSGAVQAAGGVDSTVNFSLSILPPSVAVAGLFIIGCFISTAMGTSVGTIAALAPIAVGISDKTGIAGALCIGAVVSGAMFGDNLSMISDTTIAATRTQGCEMKDKFRENFKIVLPAAVISLVLFLILASGGDYTFTGDRSYNLFKILPYLVVLIGALLGMNVFVVLALGIVLSLVVGVATGAFAWTDMFRVVFEGPDGAGGHEKVVKPIRLGRRHGHEVIVNRQLCIANAFEQVLEERTPGFHRALRHFYDTYGFPVARLIHSKYTADLVYFIMKPLEWIFLCVLYLTDAHPENRIAVQYTGKTAAQVEK